jgi:hypothetical protein
VRRFEEIAARRRAEGCEAEIVSVHQPRRVVEREPRVRELEMLGLIAQGNADIKALTRALEKIGTHARPLRPGRIRS